jgi:predicted esterase
MRRIAALAACLLASATALAVPPDRADLAAAYVRIDRLAQRLPKTPENRVALNKGFDGLTDEFFGGLFNRALTALANLEADVLGLKPEAREELLYLVGHRFALTPRVITAGAEAETILKLSAIKLDGMAEGVQPVGAVFLAGPVRVEVPYQREVSVSLPAKMHEGPIDLFLMFEHLGDIPVGKAYSLKDGLEARSAAIATRIAALEKAGTADASSLASLKARAALLSQDANRAQSASFLADIPALATAVEQELADAEAGKRPYAKRGEIWRVYRALGIDLPTRQYCPEGDGPFPLVVAFHGAGGDENMFFDGYGDGTLAKLAFERKFALVSPPTIPFSISPRLFDRFVDEVARDMPIDRSRVLLVGHSMGAMAASRLAVGSAPLVAGAACIAGFSDGGRDRVAAPRAVYLAELDPIFAAERMRASVENARGRGLDIEVSEIKDEGHTLVVDQVLPAAIDWLLARPARTTATVKPTASTPSTSPMKTDGPAPADSDSKPSAGPRK